MISSGRAIVIDDPFVTPRQSLRGRPVQESASPRGGYCRISIEPYGAEKSPQSSSIECPGEGFRHYLSPLDLSPHHFQNWPVRIRPEANQRWRRNSDLASGSGGIFRLEDEGQ